MTGKEVSKNMCGPGAPLSGSQQVRAARAQGDDSLYEMSQLSEMSLQQRPREGSREDMHMLNAQRVLPPTF